MLSISFLEKQFTNPLVLASGIWGVTADSLGRAVCLGCGGVTAKSISKEPREGHLSPIIVGREHYLVNAVGLSNPGVEEEVEELKKYKARCDAPLFGSIFAGNASEFSYLAERLCQSPIDFLEINISCPNVAQEFGSPFAYSTKAVEEITKQVKTVSRVPITIKLSPNAWNISEIAKAAESAGADAITAVNTMPGMVIDVYSRKPVLHNKVGGMSGPGLFPIALKYVYDIYKAIKIPIIGTGGVTTGEDALAMIMAGATLVGVGSAVYFRGDEAFNLINQEMEEIMREEGINSMVEIRGSAHL